MNLSAVCTTVYSSCGSKNIDESACFKLNIMFGSGYRTNEANLSMKRKKKLHFNSFDKDRKYTNVQDALILKSASATDIEKNRHEIRCEIIRTNLLRYTIAIILIFLILMTFVCIS